MLTITGACGINFHPIQEEFSARQALQSLPSPYLQAYIYFVTYKALKSKNSINTKHDNLSKYMKAKVLKQSCPFYESSERVSNWNS